jgi:[DsrC]-trisulfide reductase subunit O
MEDGRRGFLKIAGLTVLALAGRRSLAALSGAAEDTGAAPGAEGSATRWAMVLDPEKCISHPECTDCIAACNHAHNVPSIPDRKHEVKWVWEEKFPHAFPEVEAEYVDEKLTGAKVLVFCNHCDNPPCVRVCPTQATWRRSDGVVMMDWHRCIGCRYCMAACPYGSRSFNWEDPRPYIKDANPDFPTRTKGVVEKCTFCDERLARGQAPACVDACKEKALVFGNLDDPRSAVRELLRAHFALRRKPELGTGPGLYYLV